MEAAPHPDPSSHLTLLSHVMDPRGAGQRSQSNAGPTAEPMTTGALSNTAIRQIRALALGERLQPATRTETEARAAHPALVREIFSTLRGTLARHVGSPPGL